MCMQDDTDGDSDDDDGGGDEASSSELGLDDAERQPGPGEGQDEDETIIHLQDQINQWFYVLIDNCIVYFIIYILFGVRDICVFLCILFTYVDGGFCCR